MNDSMNVYRPFAARILSVKKHTEIEYTFRVEYKEDEPVYPGQFFEVSIPKFGEAPISVSGIGDGFVEMTIRRVGKVTNEVFETYEGGTLLLRGPYGNHFDLGAFRGKELIVCAGGTGAAPVRPVIEHFAAHPEEVRSLTVLESFRKENEILFKDDFDRYKETAKVTVSLTREASSETYPLGRITNFIPDLAFEDIDTACAVVIGPGPLMYSTAEALVKLGLHEENIWISEERKMCCGLGKCGHCRIGSTYVCLDGPVFNYTFAKTLQD